MNNVQKVFMAAAATAALGTGSLGLSTALAAEPNHRPGMDNLVQAIASKFNLNIDDVQQVFDEQRYLGQAERKAEFAEHATEKLAQAVTDGKLTQAQADLITAKLAELQANKPELTGKTPEEMRETMKAQKEELKKWAADNGLPAGFLPAGHGPHPFMRHMKAEFKN